METSCGKEMTMLLIKDCVCLIHIVMHPTGQTMLPGHAFGSICVIVLTIFNRLHCITIELGVYELEPSSTLDGNAKSKILLPRLHSYAVV